MIWPFRRRRRSAPAALIESSRAGLDRALGALPRVPALSVAPAVGVADIFVDLAARTGVDLGEVAERVFDRLGELAAQAGGEAGALAETDTARQLREVAARAAGRAAEVAYRAGAERLLDAVPRRRRSHRGALLLSVAGGLAATAAIAYLLSRRRAADTARNQPPQQAAADTTPSLAELPSIAAARVTAPVTSALDSLKQRYALARGEAEKARTETERELWRQYTEDVYHTTIAPATDLAIPPPPQPPPATERS